MRWEYLTAARHVAIRARKVATSWAEMATSDVDWQHRWQHRVDRTGNICLDATDVSNWKADRSDAVFMQFLHIMVQERDQSQGLTLPANFPRVASAAAC